MRLKLIIPAWAETSIWKNMIFRFPYLSITTLAALTPKDWEIKIEDENVSPINFDEDTDLVGITALTPLAPRAYEIAAGFRKKGVKVAMGGFHATWLPDEAKQYVDSVVIGEAEGVWQKVLDDFKENQMKPFYKNETRLEFRDIPPARRDLLDRKGYFFINTVQTTRGCPFNCEFCSVTSFYGQSYRPRPLEEVEEELKTISGGANFLFIVDDNIVGNPSYAKKLLETLKRHPFKWLSQASVTFAENPEILRLAQESRCYGMFVGFETLTQEGLRELNKKCNRVDNYTEVIKRFHDHGIGVLGSFIFGYDWDTKDSFDRVLEFTEKAKLDGALFTILTPYPGTKVFERLKREGRLLTTDWSKYDMAHVVFKPKNMTVEDIEEGYLRVNRGFYSYTSMLKRLPAFRKSLLVFGPMNWGMRKAWREFSY